MIVHVNAATLRGLTSFLCVLYNALSENHSVHNSPPPGGGGGGGGGVGGSIASSRPKRAFTLQLEMQR